MVYIIIFAILILLFYLISPSIRKHPLRDRLRGIFVAHRGLHGNGVPENSLTAFALAVQNGYGVELDIHLTFDGEVVVFHDDTLKRVCGADKRIKDLTYAELSEYTLSGTNEKIPTLAEALSVIDGKALVVIEFKCLEAGCEKLCMAADKILSEYDGDYIVQSFNPLPMNWYRKNRRGICRGQLSTDFFKEPKLNALKIMAGVLMLNMISRPDFISYDRRYAHSVPRKICSALGAIRAGWTFLSQEQIDSQRKNFDIFIFEGFLPKQKND